MQPVLSMNLLIARNTPLNTNMFLEMTRKKIRRKHDLREYFRGKILKYILRC
jgi:hypothetical protein